MKTLVKFVYMSVVIFQNNSYLGWGKEAAEENKLRTVKKVQK
jgi:hypothetical protein